MSASQEPPDFEAAMERLDRIVRELESEQVPLDRAITLFEEGLKLGTHCNTLLEKAQLRVEKLLEKVDGSSETQPFEPPESG